MSKRSQVLESIAGTIADYRMGQIPAPTPEHVDTWINQFDKAVQMPMLAEMDYVLKRTYMPKRAVKRFLSALAENEKLAGGDPSSFWKDVGFLDIQGGGNSQHEMLEMIGNVLRKMYGLDIEHCGENPKAFLYLDDAIFTGNRIKNDIISWVSSHAPPKVKLHAVTIALHRGGQYYARREIEKAAEGAGKEVDISWWRCVEIEDRKTYIDSSDVLRPTALPNDQLSKEYVKTFTHPLVFRTPGSVGGNKFFSSEEGRNLLEQELLKAGVQIRSLCPHLNVYQRPLGNMILESLGFGSLLVTFRNCPNNCPLAFWASNPWYPLFPRKTN